MGVFDEYKSKVYKDRFSVSVIVDELHGGIPKNPDIAEAWIRKNLGEQTDAQIADLVARTMLEMGVDQEQAIQEASRLKNLNGFKRDEQTGELFIEGRQVKAMLKEAANSLWPKRRWSESRKGTRSFFAEHVFVSPDRIGLGVTEPSGIHQRFVATWKGTGIQLEEYVRDAKVTFEVFTDQDITKDDWGQLWTHAENIGLGAARSMGFGTFEVVEWNKQ